MLRQATDEISASGHLGTVGGGMRRGDGPGQRRASHGLADGPKRQAKAFKPPGKCLVTFSYNCIYKSKMARLVRSFTIYKVTPLKKVIAMLNEGKWTALSTGYTN
jgi:hypothetical protein